MQPVSPAMCTNLQRDSSLTPTAAHGLMNAGASELPDKTRFKV